MKPLPFILGLAGTAAFLLSGRSHADVVTEWNAIAESTIRASIGAPPLQSRALSIVNASIFDAVNGIARSYQQYRPDIVNGSPAPGARQEAAAIQAAYTALVGLFPAQKPVLDQALADSLAQIPGIQGKSVSIARGLAWGEHVATAILAWRANDGASAPVVFLGGTGIGEWHSIPDFGVPMVTPQVATMTPFTMSSPSQFRPGPPPALASPQYAADLNEVKLLGRVDSTVRTPEQTLLAKLWAVTGVLDENAAIRSVVPAGYSLADTARLFALCNFCATDAAIAGFDAKVTYIFWRPFHAIRGADLDGNPETEADSAWTSLIVAPNHPEYVSTHSIITGGGMTAAALILGDDTPFTLTAFSLPGVSADYDSFSQAIEEVQHARIWSGIHYRNSCAVGAQMGQAIAAQAVAGFLAPSH